LKMVLMLSRLNKIQAGAELFQAQVKLGLFELQIDSNQSKQVQLSVLLTIVFYLQNLQHSYFV
jgi:hypothetical protein